MRLDTGLRHLKTQNGNKEALETQKVQAACKSLANTEGIILLEISLVLMLVLSSSPPPGHPDTYIACQMYDAELLPPRQS